MQIRPNPLINSHFIYLPLQEKTKGIEVGDRACRA